jgi:hypothetical protein
MIKKFKIILTFPIVISSLNTAIHTPVCKTPRNADNTEFVTGESKALIWKNKAKLKHTANKP